MITQVWDPLISSMLFLYTFHLGLVFQNSGKLFPSTCANFRDLTGNRRERLETQHAWWTCLWYHWSNQAVSHPLRHLSGLRQLRGNLPLIEQRRAKNESGWGKEAKGKSLSEKINASHCLKRCAVSLPYVLEHFTIPAVTTGSYCFAKVCPQEELPNLWIFSHQGDIGYVSIILICMVLIFMFFSYVWGHLYLFSSKLYIFALFPLSRG